MIPATEPLDLEQVKIDPAWALRVPASLALRRQVLPFAALNGHVYVACADPSDTAALEAVERFTGKQAIVSSVDRTVLKTVLARVYGDGSGRISGTLVRPGAVEAEPDGAVSLVDELLRAALLRQASDIHIDPTRADVRVRLRVDGVLEDYRRLPTPMHTALCSRIKVLASMDIAERRAPQDGAFTHRFGSLDSAQAIDVRVASLPTKFGERLTLRLLAMDCQGLSLERLGMSPSSLQAMERVLAQPHGLALLTGPTGSGKTTTLYSALQRLLASGSLNVITIEDPIEYDIPGAAQVEVDSADKVSFAKSLRSVLRHDPDVVMIGEIRDLDTLDVAVKAALTGHLVLSTLHTNSAVSAVTRLINMGLEPYLIGATLRVSVAQRLVRRLCRHCRKQRALNRAEAHALGSPDLAEAQVYEAHGCMYCAGRGFVGRMGVFECMAPDAETAALISKGVTEAELLAAIKAKNFRGLMEDAAMKVLAGLTTVKEVLEVVTES